MFVLNFKPGDLRMDAMFQVFELGVVLQVHPVALGIEVPYELVERVLEIARIVIFQVLVRGGFAVEGAFQVVELGTVHLVHPYSSDTSLLYNFAAESLESTLEAALVVCFQGRVLGIKAHCAHVSIHGHVSHMAELQFVAVGAERGVQSVVLGVCREDQRVADPGPPLRKVVVPKVQVPAVVGVEALQLAVVLGGFGVAPSTELVKLVYQPVAVGRALSKVRAVYLE